MSTQVPMVRQQEDAGLRVSVRHSQAGVLHRRRQGQAGPRFYGDPRAAPGAHARLAAGGEQGGAVGTVSKYVLVWQRGPPVVRRVLHRRRAVAHGARALEEILEHAVEYEVRLEDVAEALAPPARRDGQRLATLWQSNGSRLRGAREEKEGNIGISRRLREKGAQPFRRDGSRRAPNTGAGTPPDETSVRVFTHLARSC